MLIGLAGAGRLFKPEVLKAMGECNKAPIIFPMSNPTSKVLEAQLHHAKGGCAQCSTTGYRRTHW